MVVRHHEETHAKLGLPLDIDWPQYRRLERAGTYKILGAFAGGRLVGYNAFWLQPTMQSRATLQAFNDVLFLEPGQRRGLAGARLIREAEPWLRELGARRVVYYVPDPDLNRSSTGAKLARLLSRLGYPAYETSHARML